MNAYDFMKQVYQSNKDNKCYLDGESIEFVKNKLNKLSKIEVILNERGIGAGFELEQYRKIKEIK